MTEQVTTDHAEVSDLTDEHISLLWRQSALGDPTQAPSSRLARFAYALGRDAGLKEAAEKCEWMSEQYPTDVFPEHGVSKDCESARWARRVSSNCALAIRALIDAPDTNSSGGGNATAAADRGVRTTPSEAAVSDAGNREAAASPDAAPESGERDAGATVAHSAASKEKGDE